MIRFPNPKSDPISLRDFFRDVIYALFQAEGMPPTGLGHDDFSRLGAELGGVTSGGQIGLRALASSVRKDRSLNPMFNQMKMLTELYRLLGWLMPVPEGRNHFLITPLGRQAASFVGAGLDVISYDGGALSESEFWEHCLLNICFPHPHVDANLGASQRTFLLILTLVAAVGGFITRDELILTAFRITNDRNPMQMDNCVSEISMWRSEAGAAAFGTARERAIDGIQWTTMENYTRFPIAIMEELRWFEKIQGNDLDDPQRYQFRNELGEASIGRTVVLHLTDRGQTVLDVTRRLHDLRAEDLPKGIDDLAALAVLVEACRRRRTIALEASALLTRGVNILRDIGVTMPVESGQLIPLPILFEPFQQLPSNVMIKALQLAED